jgi:hypothetical protein
MNMSKSLSKTCCTSEADAVRKYLMQQKRYNRIDAFAVNTLRVYYTVI